MAFPWKIKKMRHRKNRSRMKNLITHTQTRTYYNMVVVVDRWLGNEMEMVHVQQLLEHQMTCLVSHEQDHDSFLIQSNSAPWSQLKLPGDDDVERESCSWRSTTGPSYGLIGVNYSSKRYERGQPNVSNCIRISELDYYGTCHF